MARDEEIALFTDQRQCCRYSGTLKLISGLLCVLVVIGAGSWIVVRGRFDVRSSWDLYGISEPGSLSFLALGDWGRLGLYNQSFVARQMGKIAEALNVEFVVSTGDNFYKNGLTGVDDPQFQQSFTDIYTSQSLQKPWHAVLGNHDYHGDVLSQLDSQLTLRDWRWHCFRDGQLVYELGSKASLRLNQELELLELFFIDTTPFVGEYWDQKKHSFDWRGILPDKSLHLEQKLKNLSSALESSKARWKIVVGHHTIRSFGNHGDTAELVSQVLPILEANNVDVYLNGHDHCVQHIKREDSGVHFVTSGGGSKAWKGVSPSQNSNGLQFYYDGQGFVSVSVSENFLRITYYDIHGAILHTVQLSKQLVNLSL